MDVCFRSGGDVVPTFQFRRQISKDIVDNTIGMYVNDDRRLAEDTSSPTIVCCYPQQVKPYHGWYNRHNKIQKSITEISKKMIHQL